MLRRLGEVHHFPRQESLVTDAAIGQNLKIVKLSGLADCQYPLHWAALWSPKRAAPCWTTGELLPHRECFTGEYGHECAGQSADLL
jgi:hypothetical protein